MSRFVLGRLITPPGGEFDLKEGVFKGGILSPKTRSAYLKKPLRVGFKSRLGPKSESRVANIWKSIFFRLFIIKVFVLK